MHDSRIVFRGDFASVVQFDVASACTNIIILIIELCFERMIIRNLPVKYLTFKGGLSLFCTALGKSVERYVGVSRTRINILIQITSVMCFGVLHFSHTLSLCQRGLPLVDNNYTLPLSNIPSLSAIFATFVEVRRRCERYSLQLLVTLQLHSWRFAAVVGDISYICGGSPKLSEIFATFVEVRRNCERYSLHLLVTLATFVQVHRSCGRYSLQLLVTLATTVGDKLFAADLSAVVATVQLLAILRRIIGETFHRQWSAMFATDGSFRRFSLAVDSQPSPAILACQFQAIYLQAAEVSDNRQFVVIFCYISRRYTVGVGSFQLLAIIIP